MFLTRCLTVFSCTPGGVIGQVCAIGDRRPYNTALITLDPDGLRAFAARRRLGEATPTALAADERVRAEVADQVDRGNQRLARAEQIKDFVLLGEDWAPGGDELTPTMKLKRKPIAEKYLTQIAALYRAR
jgi:long-chain acyl-CoA synthetase